MRVELWPQSMPIVRVTDVQGYEVLLEDERWEHILDGHPEMKDLRDLLLETLRVPELILRDPDRPEVFFYYRLTGRSIWRRNDIYISAVVERSDGNKVARVKTAHLVKQTKKDGVLVWLKRGN
jgi:hypothetical protein